MTVEIEIEDFQSIASTVLVVEGLTAITGQNNAGKSAVIRAVSGAFQNTPGTSFVRYGSEECMVRVKVSGHTVEWRKGDKIKPTFVLDDGDPLYPGRGVPEEIYETGLRPIEVNGRDLWPQIASQVTGQVFLLDSPGSVLAEAVADVDRVGRLNEAKRMAESDRRSIRSRLKVRREDQKGLEDRLSAFENLDDLGAVVEALAQREAALELDKAEIESFEVLSARLVKSRRLVSRLGGVEEVSIPRPVDADAILDEIRALVQLDTRRKEALVVAESLRGVEAVDVDVPDPTAKVDKILKAVRIVVRLRDQRSNAVDALDDIRAKLAEVSGAVEEAESAIQELSARFSTCPTCGQEIDSHDVQDHE